MDCVSVHFNFNDLLFLLIKKRLLLLCTEDIYIW